MAFTSRRLSILRPRSAEALLDEEAFEHEEFLPYWAELWASGEALARTIAERDVSGMRVVELGCGLALPSLAAALGRAHVLATDWAPDAAELARENARRNELELETAIVRWSEPKALLERAPWDLVLAADVLYERRNVDELLALLPQLGSNVLLAEDRAERHRVRAHCRYRRVSSRLAASPANRSKTMPPTIAAMMIRSLVAPSPELGFGIATRAPACAARRCTARVAAAASAAPPSPGLGSASTARWASRSGLPPRDTP